MFSLITYVKQVRLLHCSKKDMGLKLLKTRIKILIIIITPTRYAYSTIVKFFTNFLRCSFRSTQITVSAPLSLY